MNKDFKPDYEKAKLAVKEKKEANAHLKQDFLDLTHWKELASKYGVRLPSYYQPATETKYLRRLFKKLDLDINEYVEACGAKGIKSLVNMNTNYPAYAEVGLALEWIDDRGLDS